MENVGFITRRTSGSRKNQELQASRTRFKILFITITFQCELEIGLALIKWLFNILENRQSCCANRELLFQPRNT
jgi:hypothetical protein